MKRHRGLLLNQASRLAILMMTLPVGLAHAQGTTPAKPAEEANAPEETGQVERVTVTARKRSEDQQDAPISIQAITARKLEQFNADGFESYVRFTPSVSFISQGPGQSKIIIRGVAESTGSADGGGRSSSALYLDEQPITVDASSPDPRLVDIERIEVLSGPQGTLYGASSQSGTIRIITKKPDLQVFEGYLEATGKLTEHGSPSYDFNGAINIPLIPDELALRVVGYTAEEGGFIDNVFGTTPGGTVDNANVVGEDVNAARTDGTRVSLRWQVNSDWRATASHIFQDVNVDGRSDYDPTVGDLQAVRFFKETFADQWDQSALTVEGNLGFADLVVTGAYFNRKTSYVDDNTAYDQYLTTTSAYFPLYDFGLDPTGDNLGRTGDERTTFEARLTSRNESRWAWIVGAFYQDAENDFVTNSRVTDFALTPGFAFAQAELAAALLPPLAPTDTYFFQIGRYETQQFAIFGELSYDITEQLTATIGGRWFTVEGDGRLETQLPFGATATLVDGLGRPVTTVESSALPFSEEGFTPKINLSYKADEDLLLYATYSEGFRLGGANRQRLGLSVPVQYDADKLFNYELGVKSQWMGGKLTLNGAAFLMRWEDFISDVRNPNPATFYFVTANAGQAEIIGIEGEFAWRVLDNLSIGGSATLLSAELSEPSAILAGGVPEGARLPVTPEFKFAMYGEYTFPVEALQAEGYLRADYSYTGDSVNSIEPLTANLQEAYSITNLQVGMEKETWRVNLFLNNVFDERAQLFINPNKFDARVTPNRPRELGLTVRRSF
jgi:iron complex outermembrane recepter protein